METEKVMLVLVILFVISVFCFMGYFMITQQQCLSNGYKETKITWNLEQYWIREENEYEIVKSLNEIKLGD